MDDQLNKKLTTNAICKLNTNKGLAYINCLKVTHIQASDDDCMIYLKDEEQPITAKYTLKKIIDKFPEIPFLRCHYSYLVNAIFIRHLCPSGNFIELKNNKTIPLAQRRRKAIEKELDILINTNYGFQ